MHTLYHYYCTDSEQLGETALKVVKHSRGELQRLKEIDVRLKHLETSTDDNENVSCIVTNIIFSYKI